MNLRKIRKSRKLTMKELGERVGVTESAIGQYETGKRSPSFEVLLKISEELGCSVDDLLRNPEEIEESDEVVEELRALKNDKDFRVLLNGYKKMTPAQVRIMKSFMKSLFEDEEDAD